MFVTSTITLCRNMRLLVSLIDILLLRVILFIYYLFHFAIVQCFFVYIKHSPRLSRLNTNRYRMW